MGQIEAIILSMQAPFRSPRQILFIPSNKSQMCRVRRVQTRNGPRQAFHDRAGFFHLPLHLLQNLPLYPKELVTDFDLPRGHAHEALYLPALERPGEHGVTRRRPLAPQFADGAALLVAGRLVSPQVPEVRSIRVCDLRPQRPRGRQRGQAALGEGRRVRGSTRASP